MVGKNRSEGSVFKMFSLYIFIYLVFSESRIISSSYGTFRLPNPLSIFTEPGILIYRTLHPSQLGYLFRKVNDVFEILVQPFDLFIR